MTLAGWSACRSGPEPEVLYREAEGLRLRYEKSASELAIAKFRAAASAFSRAGELREAARANQRVGQTFSQLGLLHQSLAAYVAALGDAKASGDLALQSEISSEIGTARSLVAVRESDFDEAQKHCEGAMAMARRAGDERAASRALMCRGEAAYNRGERERALGLYGEAATVSRRLGDTRGEAEALLNQGTVLSDQSDFARAESCLSGAQAAWAALGDARGTAIALVALSKLSQRRGEYQEALNGLQEALAALQTMGDAVWEGTGLTAMGTVYLHMGDAARARAYWERASERFDAAGLKSFSVDLLMSLGEAYLASGDDGRALDRFERALALGTELGDDHWQAYALRFIGLAHLVRRDHATAITQFERSLAVQERIRDPRFQAQTRADLGEAWRLAGDAARARTSFEAAVSIGRVAGDRLSEANGLNGLARVSMSQGDLATARADIEQALHLVESLRARIEVRDLRAAYFASVHRYHETHMDVLMRLHKAEPGRGLDAAAFEASERARARSLLDGLAEAGVDLRKGVDPALLQRERALKEEFDAWAARQRETMDGRASPAVTERLRNEYRDLESRFGELEAQIRSKSPRYAALAKPRPLTLRQVQELVLDDDTVLLEYALGDDRSYLWAVSASGHSVHELPPRAELERAAQRTYARLTARLGLTGTIEERGRQAEESDFQFWEQATQLSRVLLEPVAGALSRKRIVVVADGALQYVPFGALPEPGGGAQRVPLLAGHEVVNLPSASALAVLRRETAGRAPLAGAVAVLADPVFERDDPRVRAAVRASGASPGASAAGPDLARPFRFARLAATRLEADAIIGAAGQARSLKRLDFEASRAAALRPELGQYRIVHFATHGVFDNGDPGMSGIMLSLFDGQGRAQDGFLRLHDIYGLTLPVELVVLSACSTALGKQVTVEGLVGVVRGFMYAGARRVVASLWKVDDEATGELMRRFYQGMLEQRLSPASALREAQLGLWRQARWKSPFYWAAFSLQGEWRP